MNQNQTTLGNMFGIRLWLALVLIVAFIPATSSIAQGDDAQHELEGARQRVHEMLRHAEELQESGHIDAADEMRRDAHEMANRIEEHLAQLRRGQGEQDQAVEHLHKVLEGLEHGMAALRELGKHEELRALEHVAHEVRQELESKRDRPQRERQREHRSEGNEREMAMHQLEILRIAMHGLREGERRDAADLLERAIHVRELALEGVRNEKAQEARRRAPNRAQLSEILGLASRLWDEFGNEDKAHIVGELAEQMRQRNHRDRDEHAQREREKPIRDAHDNHQDRDGHEDRERHEGREHQDQDVREGHDRLPERLQVAMERIEHLEAQIKRLGAAMERMQGQLHDRERDRR